MRRRPTSPGPIVHRIASATVVVLSLVVPVLFASGSGRADVQCTFEPRTVRVQIVDEPVTLSVGSGREILVNGQTCSTLTSSPTTATIDSAGAVAVAGTDAADRVEIDQGGPGGAFPPGLSFALDLRFDSGDSLGVVATAGADQVTAVASTLQLVGSDGDVQLGGVDAVDVELGAGDDVVDASLIDVDSPDFSIPLTVLGGDGDDRVTGGEGADRLYGQGGDDVLDGNDGTDFLNGGLGTDVCWFVDSLICDPTLELQPREGAAGTPVLATGTGWYPENGDVAISFPGQAPVFAPPDPGGGFSADLEVPAAGDESAIVTVTACQRCEDEIEPVVATNDFTFTATPNEELSLAVTPDTATIGEPVTVSGSGWFADETVSLFLDPAGDVLGETAAATATADESGLFSEALESTQLDPGEHRIVACQRCGAGDERSEEAVFVLEAIEGTPTIRVEPDLARAGDTIEVVGANWRPGLGRVHLSIGSETTEDGEVGAIRPEADGSFVASVVLPDLAEGSYTVTACQRCAAAGRIEDARPLTIEAAASSPLPWILGAAALLLIAGVVYAVFRPRKPKVDVEHPPPRVRARARPSSPQVTVRRDPGGSDHRIRLVPRSDRGTQRVEEATHT